MLTFSGVQAASPFNSAISWKLEADVQPQSLDPLQINGRLLDELQQPVADARIGCWVKTWDHHWKLISKTTTDLNGDYKLDATFIRDLDERYSAIARRHLSSDPFRTSMGPMLDGEIEQYGFSVYVFAATPADRVAWGAPQILLSRSQIECDLDLQPTGGSVYGVLHDASGDVVVGEEIKLGSIFQQQSEKFLGPYLSPLGLASGKRKQMNSDAFDSITCRPTLRCM